MPGCDMHNRGSPIWERGMEALDEGDGAIRIGEDLVRHEPGVDGGLLASLFHRINRLDILRILPLLERHQCSRAPHRSLPCGCFLPGQDGWNEGGCDGSGHLGFCFLCLPTSCW